MLCGVWFPMPRLRMHSLSCTRIATRNLCRMSDTFNLQRKYTSSYRTDCMPKSLRCADDTTRKAWKVQSGRIVSENGYRMRVRDVGSRRYVAQGYDHAINAPAGKCIAPSKTGRRKSSLPGAISMTSSRKLPPMKTARMLPHKHYTYHTPSKTTATWNMVKPLCQLQQVHPTMAKPQDLQILMSNTPRRRALARCEHHQNLQSLTI